MLQKFSKKVDWKRLSGQVYGSVEWFTEAHLEEFKDKWDWTLLSNNISLITENTIDKFIDYWDWDALIDGSHYFKDFVIVLTAHLPQIPWTSICFLTLMVC